MSADPKDKLQSRVLAKIPVYPDQELHIRLRTLEEEAPQFLEFSQFNLQGAGYRLACYIPKDIGVISQLIRHLHHIRDEIAQEKL